MRKGNNMCGIFGVCAAIIFVLSSRITKAQMSAPDNRPPPTRTKTSTTTTKEPIPPPDQVTEQDAETTTVNGNQQFTTDIDAIPTDEVGPTDIPKSDPTGEGSLSTDSTKPGSTGEAPQPTESTKPGPTGEEPPPTDSSKPGPTNEGPPPTDGPKPGPTNEGPPPTDGPKPGPTDDGPPPTDGHNPGSTDEGPPPSEGPKPGPTDEGPPPTDGPKPGPTDEGPPPTDGHNPGSTDEGPPPSEGPKPGPTDEGPPPTDGPKPGPTDEGPPPTDGPKPGPTDEGPLPTDGPKPGPTDEGPPPTDGPKPGPTDEGPPPTDGPKPGPTDEGPPPTDGPKPGSTDEGPLPTDGPKPGPTDEGPLPTDDPKPGPTDEGPPPSEGPKTGPTDKGPPPTDGPKPGPTDEGPLPTDGPKPGPTDEGPPPTDGPKPGPTDEGPLPTDGPKPGPTDEGRPQTEDPKPGPTDEGPPPTDDPKPGPTDERPPPTDGPKPGPTDEGPPQTDGPRPGPTDEGPPPTDGPKPGPTEEGPPPTHSTRPGSTGEKPPPTDEIEPTDNPKPPPTDDIPKSTDTPAPKCGEVPDIEFGLIIATSGISADVVCDKGYSATKNTINCLDSGVWEQAECLVKDCGPLQSPDNGFVEIPNGTTYNNVALYRCTDGFSLVGDSKRTCLASGNWNGLTPDCIQEGERITTCPDDIDGKGRPWNEVLVGKTRVKACSAGFTGNITRRCKQGGRWEVPINNCVRKRVQGVEENVAELGSNSTEDDVNEILEDITDVTMPNETLTDEELLTDGELDVLATSLEKVVETVISTNITSDILSDNITDDVIESASNLIDDTNQESWQILRRTNSRGAERVLTAVDSIGDALCPVLKRTGRRKKTVVKRNVAFEVQKVSDDDVLFPNEDAIQDAGDDDWLRTTRSKIRLRSASLKGKVSPCSITTVMYRNLSEILPTQTTTSDDSSDAGRQPPEIINAPILAMSISPPVSGKIDPPVSIAFEHADSSLTEPTCVFWQFQNDSQGNWSSEGCSVAFTNETYTICECDHLTNFAILMSPFSEADASSQALRIISIIGIGVSVVCLLITCAVHFYFWRHVRNDRTTRLMALCIALLLSYIIFLAGVDRTESKIACAVIAAIIQYIYLVVFCVMLVEGVEIAVTVLYVFKTKSRTKLLIFIAWVIPAVIVGISLGVTKLNGYGNENFCWLSISNGVIWAFVGPALVIIFLNIICLAIVIRAMFRSTAVRSKKASEKIRTSLWSLCVLVPIMGISWILGIFYVNDSFYFIQYIFAILNGMQGFFIFLFHCLLNKQVKNAYKLHARKKSATYFTSNPTSKDDRNTKSKEKSITNDDSKARDSGNDRKNKIMQESFPKSPVQFGTSLGMYSKGSLRRSAPFSTDSRARLMNDSSIS